MLDKRGQKKSENGDKKNKSNINSCDKTHIWPNKKTKHGGFSVSCRYSREDENRDGCGSQQSSAALGGAAAAEQHLPFHAADLVVVVPGQLRASTDPSGIQRKSSSISSISYNNVFFSWWQVVGCCSSSLELNITVTWRVICSPPAKDTEMH